MWFGIGHPCITQRTHHHTMFSLSGVFCQGGCVVTFKPIGICTNKLPKDQIVPPGLVATNGGWEYCCNDESVQLETITFNVDSLVRGTFCWEYFFE